MSEPNSSFIFLWINTMLNDYKVKKWAYLSGILPTVLVQRYNATGLVHVEHHSIHKPSWQNVDQIIGNTIYDWSKNYAVHLWKRRWIKSKYWDKVKL